GAPPALWLFKLANWLLYRTVRKERYAMAEVQSLLKEQIKEWEVRRDAVINYKNALQELYIRIEPDAQNLSLSPIEKLVDKILDQTEAFGTDMYDFFHNGLTKGGTHIFEQHEGEESFVTGDYMLNAVVDQLTSDLVVIERILLQRVVAKLGDAPGQDRGKAFRQMIQMAEELMDKLALACIYMFTQHLAPNSTALTYFHRSPRSRLMPYAPAALIALPPTARFSALDLLALPHEFGHYLYWNGLASNIDSTDSADKRLYFQNEFSSYGQTTFPMQLASDNRVINSWIEEIFADVISCMIAGPLAAYSMQKVLMRTPASLFKTNDRLHPSPILRPYIHLLTLQKLGVCAHKIDALETRWRQILNDDLDFRLPDASSWVDRSFSVIEYRQYGDLNINIHAQIQIGDLAEVVHKIVYSIQRDDEQKSLSWSLGQDWDGTIDQLENDIRQINLMLERYAESGMMSEQSSASSTAPDPVTLNRLSQILNYENISSQSLDWCQLSVDWSWQTQAQKLLNRMETAQLSPAEAPQQRPSAKPEDVIAIIENAPHALPTETDEGANPTPAPSVPDPIKIGAPIWSRLLWFDGWTSGPGGPGHIPDHPFD
ncbi:MAG: hypothetical protein KDE46_21785, partial [Caldilineaceae bacterium]|nr:hypothetical protein [Caldilineaceae bacterium]